MGAWAHFELGRYTTALEVADAGLAEVAGKLPGAELHLRELIAALGAWDDVPQRLDEMRRHASIAGTVTLVAFADRLEGRAAMATGDPAAAAPALERSVATFDQLGASWERALSEMDLARALAMTRAPEAEGIAARAGAAFEALGDIRHMAAARALLRSR